MTAARVKRVRPRRSSIVPSRAYVSATTANARRCHRRAARSHPCQDLNRLSHASRGPRAANRVRSHRDKKHRDKKHHVRNSHARSRQDKKRQDKKRQDKRLLVRKHLDKKLLIRKLLVRSRRTRSRRARLSARRNLRGHGVSGAAVSKARVGASRLRWRRRNDERTTDATCRAPFRRRRQIRRRAVEVAFSPANDMSRRKARSLPAHRRKDLR
jgi:hypothetical protein